MNLAPRPLSRRHLLKRGLGAGLLAASLGACATRLSMAPAAATGTVPPDYLIGAGDMVSITVWRNPDVSQSVQVRPDGKISTPLVEDLQAAGRTSTQLARDVERLCRSTYRNRW